jgi:hypothetical protein
MPARNAAARTRSVSRHASNHLKRVGKTGQCWVRGGTTTVDRAFVGVAILPILLTTSEHRGELRRLDAALVAYGHAETGNGRGGRASNNNGVAAWCECGRRIGVSVSGARHGADHAPVIRRRAVTGGY